MFNPTSYDDRISMLPDNGTLIFAKTETSDQGIYQCFAENKAGIALSIKVNFKSAGMLI